MPTVVLEPLTYHLDRRAGRLAEDAEADGAGDELMTPPEVMELLTVSNHWLELRRCNGTGPPFVRLSASCVGYRRDQLVAWLRQREFQATSQYSNHQRGRPRGSRVVNGRVVAPPAEPVRQPIFLKRPTR